MAKYSTPIGYKITLVITTLIVFSSITSSPLQNNSFAHNYTPNEFASFLAFADEFVTETNLVQLNLATNHLPLAEEHAEKASKLFYRNIVSELEERDENVADEMAKSLETLQNLSSSLSSPSSSSPQVSLSQEQQNQVDEIVGDINLKTNDLIGASISSQEEQGINFISNIIGFIRGIIGIEAVEILPADETVSKIQALRTVEIVDIVLEDYGNAYNVGFDMTDMSNMAMTMEMNNADDDGGNDDDNSSASVTDVNAIGGNTMMMDMTSMNMTDAESVEMNKKVDTLVNMADYQSAQALAQRAQDFFNTELRFLAAQNASSTSLSNLEEGLAQLTNATNNKAPPMDVMMIVHSQVHPSLQTAFDLSLEQ